MNILFRYEDTKIQDFKENDNDNDNDNILFNDNIEIKIIMYNSLENQIIDWSETTIKTN